MTKFKESLFKLKSKDDLFWIPIDLYLGFGDSINVSAQELAERYPDCCEIVEVDGDTVFMCDNEFALFGMLFAFYQNYKLKSQQLVKR